MYYKAKTITEAENYAKNLGIRQVCYNGFNLRSVNEINLSLYENIKQYPSITEYLHYVGCIDTYNKLYNDNVELTISEIACISSIDIRIYTALLVNKCAVNKRKKLKQTYKLNHSEKYIVVRNFNCIDAINHEIGHVITFHIYKLNINKLIELDDYTARYFDRIKKSKRLKFTKNNLSEYAYADVCEAIAECYAEYLGKHPRFISKHITEKLLSCYKDSLLDY